MDLSCTDDIDPTLRSISGSREVVEQVYRELITPSGGLWWDTTRGLGLSKYINAAATPGLASQIAGQCEAVALRHDRVSNARASVTLGEEGFTLVIALSLNDGTTDTFTVSIDKLGSSLIYG